MKTSLGAIILSGCLFTSCGSPFLSTIRKAGELNTVDHKTFTLETQIDGEGKWSYVRIVPRSREARRPRGDLFCPVALPLLRDNVCSYTVIVTAPMDGVQNPKRETYREQAFDFGRSHPCLALASPQAINTVDVTIRFENSIETNIVFELLKEIPAKWQLP